MAVLRSRVTGANGRGTWKYCQFQYYLEMNDNPLSSPKKSAHRVSSRACGGETSRVERRSGKLPCHTPTSAAHQGCWPRTIRGTLSASSSLHAKSKWVRAPSTGKGVFFPTHSETFQPSQGGKPCHCSPGLHLCCQRLQGTAEVAEHG